MRWRQGVAFTLGSFVLLHGTALVSHAEPPTVEQIEKMKAAMPGKAVATPLKARKMLVFTLCKGFRHSAIECCAKALEMMGAATGAFEAVVSDDVAMFKPEKLREFDAVCFDNTTGELFEDVALKQGLLDFVRGGKGLVGIHAATDCFYNWPEFGEMMGGYFDGHPWYANNTVHVKIDEPDHPINAAFGGKSFDIMDEIYQIKTPYSREKLRVLLSLDTTRTDMSRPGIKRKDGDFAISWIRAYGKGRVFYCSLGHREDIFWNPMVLEHYLAGIQYALGDLKADATPSATALGTSWTPLFNEKDLAGWKGLV
ncbi:MAG: ThuA domain-containing protein, partial [Planctomycetes bacterium]|nr:ThuA domain-containing protein [Planctomycetota bacterium]